MRLLLVLAVVVATFQVQAFSSVASYQKALEERMEKMKNKKSSWTKEEIQLMKTESEKLLNALPNPGVQVGKKAPNFSLVNADGKTVSLESELAKGPVVLVFYRGAWCPFCNMHLRALKESLPEFQKFGAQLVAITPQTPDKSQKQFEAEGSPFEILSDLNNQTMKSYNLYFEPSKALVDVYKSHGLDLEGFNGNGRTGLPVPGTFIIDQKGIVRAMKAQTDYKIRMEPAEIVKALSSL